MSLGDLEKIALSDSEINHMLSQVPHKLITYPDLQNYESLDDLVQGVKGVVMLLEIDDDIKKAGHWICLVNHKDEIEYFDPYGLKPAQELSMTHEKPLILDKIKKTKKKIKLNTMRFQEFKHDVNTCGRWCISRLRHWPLDLGKFREFIFSNPLGLNPDYFVTYLTMGATTDRFSQ